MKGKYKRTSYHKDLISNGMKGKRNRVIHGMCGTSEYKCYQNMIARCHNPKCPAYEGYGLLGITVCDHWRKSFMNFYKDVGKKPAPHYSLDRINVFGNYEPSNVRWATPSEQTNNRRISDKYKCN